MSPATKRHLLLTGMMGAGKSTVGPLVAARLGRLFVDLDREVERAVGMTVGEIFRRLGEPAFRRAEGEALRRVLAAPEPLVVALGGGALMASDNRDAVMDAVVVWLDACPEVLADRAIGPERPLLAQADAERVAALHAARRAHYREASDLRVDTGLLTPDQAAAAIVRWWNEGGAPR